MLIPTPPKYVKRHRPLKKKVQFGPPPAALTLVEASFATDDYVSVRLTFDRAVDAGALNGAQITVGIAEYGYLYNATGTVYVIDPATIDIILVQIGGYEGEADELNATALSGIVAVDDGGTWAGIANAELPIG